MHHVLVTVILCVSVLSSVGTPCRTYPNGSSVGNAIPYVILRSSVAKLPIRSLAFSSSFAASSDSAFKRSSPCWSVDSAKASKFEQFLLVIQHLYEHV
jgi:hypothetical protein